ncbi:phosphatase PAP2 family protein [Streptomyces sp. NPDC050504]|uniref:phosphatase PAP2 family protein n=1 Tax=Streptomyces sp. NPDC050504 TaxID=3365618 RepID=UPI0037B39C94
MHSPPLTPPTHTPHRRALLTAALCGALSLALLVLVAVEWSPLMRLDRAIADGLHGWAVDSPGLTRANRVLSDWVWDPWTMRALTAVAVLWLLRAGERSLALWIAVTSVAGTLVQQGMKAAVGRERPEWPDPVDSAHYAAFPSGHAMTAAVTSGLLLWLLARAAPSRTAWRCALAAATVSVVGVGLTRLYLGVHWFTDVLAGWLLGAAAVGLAVTTYGRRRSS